MYVEQNYVTSLQLVILLFIKAIIIWMFTVLSIQFTLVSMNDEFFKVCFKNFIKLISEERQNMKDTR